MMDLNAGEPRRPRILVNASSLGKGGALQVAINFISIAIGDDSVHWHWLLSPALHEQLKDLLASKAAADSVTVLHVSAARSIRARKRVQSAERAFSADLVFTLLGPAYVRFDAPHVMGFANSWATHPNRFALGTLASPLARLRHAAASAYRRRWLKAASHWIVESEAAETGIRNRIGIPAKSITVVPNGCRDEIRRVTTSADLLSTAEEIRILSLSSYYRHKNFEIVPAVAASLKTALRNRKFQFILTLDENHSRCRQILAEAERLGVKEHIRMIGAVPMSELAPLYERCHLAFIPTLLESFSAAYSEALACGLPVVTTDLDFARAICKNAALYYPPSDAHIAAAQLCQVIHDRELREHLRQAGYKRTEDFPDSQQKYERYKKICLQTLAANGRTFHIGYSLAG